MSSRHLPFVAFALALAFTTAACSMRDANLAPGSGFARFAYEKFRPRLPLWLSRRQAGR